MGANNPRGIANLDPRSMIDRMYIGCHKTLLHTKYTGVRSCGFKEEYFVCSFFYFEPMADNDAPDAWPI